MTIKKNLTDSPKTKPADSDLVFGKYFTDHMFLCEYTEGIGWHDPEITPVADLSLSPAAMVLHYGQAIFEGLKAYRAEDGRILLFRPRDNFARLNLSAARLCIPNIDIDFALGALKELLETEKAWIPGSSGTSLYIRPFVIADEPALGVHISRSYKFIILLSPVGPYYKEGLDPVRICVEDEYVRAVRGGVGFTKAAANYAISLKGQEKAQGLGFTQVLWLDGVERRYVEEVGTMNVFFKIGGEVVTPELSGGILAGITRDSALKLLGKRGIPTAERRVSLDEVIEAGEAGRLEEAFGSGTAAVISPISEFYYAGRTVRVGTGGAGEISKWLYDELTGIQYGRREDTFGWVEALGGS
ncbi:MAG: branched-chain amino acid aminotransferase [Clostridiales bacterium]|jgi:branched-chain amino acid aminotransferase|nr:branched-chain amino acid aminotransferase [Clostridiales bacterium]